MTDIYTGIDWIFSAFRIVFTFMVSSWVMSFIVLISLLGLVVTLYLNSRQK